MTTKIKHVASNAITTAELDTSSLDSHFSGGTGVTYSGGAISIGQAVHSTDSPTFADLTITGNLNITGNIDQYNVTDLDVTDKTITLGSGQIEANSGGSGIIIDGSGASILWDETNTEWDFNSRINIPSVFSQHYSIRESGTQYGFIGQYKTLSGAGTDTSLTIFSETGDGINFAVNGSVTKAVVIDSEGDVGIGDTSPSFKLDVNTTGSRARFKASTGDANIELSSIAGRDYVLQSLSSGSFRIYDEDANASRLTIDSSGNLSTGPGTQTGNGDGNITIREGNAFAGLDFKSARTAGNIGGPRFYNTSSDSVPKAQLLIEIDGSYNFYNGSNGAERRVKINADGDFGIGTDNPLNPLHVRESGGSHLLALETAYVNDRSGRGQLSWRDSGNITGGIWTEYDGSQVSMRFGNLYNSGYNTNTSMIIRGGGNVGIGTTSPTGKFHVSGGRGGIISSSSSWGQFRVGNPGDGEVGIAYVTGATESDFLNDGNPACSYKVIMGINPYGAGTRNFGIGNDTITNYHTIWTEAGHQLPRVDNTYDLGATNYGFRNVHLSGNLYVGGHIIGDDDTSYMRMNAGPGGGGAIYLNGSTRTNFENHIQYMADVHNFGDVDGNPINTLQVVSDSELVTINGRLNVTKPIQTTTDTGTRMYTGLATGSHYNSTGYLILDTNIPSPNVSGNNMFSIHINGYSYDNSSGGIIDLKVGTYSGESYFHNPSYTGSNIPDKWVNNIRFARKTATNTVSVILGDSGTGQPNEVAATLFIQGFSGENPAYAEGWDWKVSSNTNDYTQLTKVDEKSTKRPSFTAGSNGFSVSTGWQTISDSMSQTHDGPDDDYTPSTGRFNPQLAGWYQFNFGGWATYNSSTGQERYAVAFAKNGSLQYLAGGNYSTADSPLAGASRRVYMNGSGDYVELKAYSSVATQWGGSSHWVWWDGYWTGS